MGGCAEVQRVVCAIKQAIGLNLGVERRGEYPRIGKCRDKRLGRRVDARPGPFVAQGRCGESSHRGRITGESSPHRTCSSSVCRSIG